MKNRDIYQKDPSDYRLLNNGVASVNDEKTLENLRVLRYELETFVCDGQYERGLHQILETYLENIDKPEQPAVWISGFYGSGKSHLVKMLRALWTDTTFDDGATARGIVTLPQEIKDNFNELSIQAKRHGGLFAASGTLGSAASGSVRLALLELLFKSTALPGQYPVAKFIMWLKSHGICDQVRGIVEQNGLDWEEELDNFYVAEGLHQALVQAKPNLFPSADSCVDTLNNLYPHVTDVSNDEMLKTFRQVLTKNERFPLSLIVLDEVQQYLGEDPDRSAAVQEAVESCCKHFGGKLLFIGTGQTAVTGTGNLKKLEGRFTVRVELSDADVDTVIRKVILAKKPESIPPLQQVMETNLGEISRHLSGTTVGHRQDDTPFFPKDYPILPVRRRFWEMAFRALDKTGTDAQLRNQLSMVHKVIQTNLDEDLGNVIPADYLYFDTADKLLQSSILPRKVHEKTMSWKQGSADEQLKARACGLVFLINKLSGTNSEIGIRATVDTLADLLVEDLSQGSAGLRKKLPSLLEDCELLMKVGDEFRIQTKESAAWADEFSSQCAALSNSMPRVITERDDRIQKKFREKINKLSLFQGDSRVSREILSVFDSNLPPDANQRIYVWVRNGWNVNVSAVQADARQAGNQSSTIFVHIPKRNTDELRHQLIKYKAATATLDMRGVPNTPEGAEAGAAMETIKKTAEAKINELLDEILAGSRVFQGGGNEIMGSHLREMVSEGAQNALQRLYPNFYMADNNGWSKVYEKARKGAPDALEAIGYQGDVPKNPVCKAILAFISQGKKGTDIRKQFEDPPYGWSRDAVDGALQVLLVAGLIRAQDTRGQFAGPKTLERKAIGRITFKVESTTVTVKQRIEIRKLLQKVQLNANQGKELAHVPQFLQKMMELAEKAGGDAPKPLTPDTRFLQNTKLAAGNEQLISIYNQRDEISRSINDWSKLAEQIDKRWPNWLKLKHLSIDAQHLQDADIILDQIQTIEKQRQLLDDPDPVAPLLANMTQLFRDELNCLKEEWDREWDAGSARLELDENWQKLDPDQRFRLRSKQHLTEASKPKVSVGDTDAILRTLEQVKIPAFRDRIAAMPGRFTTVLLDAAREAEPNLQEISLPSRILKNETDVETWLENARAVLLEKLKNGPIIPS